MRITAGEAKGRKLKTPQGKDFARPAMAKVREAIMSSLAPWEDRVIIDLYAGTGSLGFEALSRGAKKVVFVDSDPRSFALIRENAKILGFTSRVAFMKLHLPHGMAKLAPHIPADVIFCDPPYDKKLIAPTLAALLRHKIIDPQTWLIIEHTRREMPEISGLVLIKQKKYGQTLVSYLKLDANAPRVQDLA